eukprot:TRINITY_DN7793_c0_g8_i1.p1 TRINITY_DN7793_c0_g8~~TRINITY_DN7793_c0_g8_i1.p1  ORF type:complete len:679 (+),score=46.57 TRINITY_DN7793_c0_g8_i1:281-2038(+)
MTQTRSTQRRATPGSALLYSSNGNREVRANTAYPIATRSAQRRSTPFRPFQLLPGSVLPRSDSLATSDVSLAAETNASTAELMPSPVSRASLDSLDTSPDDVESPVGVGLFIEPDGRRRRARSVRFSEDPRSLVINASSAETLLKTTMQGLKKVSPEFLQRGSFRIAFQGEFGVDDGGLRRDFFARVGNALRDPEHGFFLPVPGACMHLRPVIESSLGVDGAIADGWKWRCLGRLLAAAVLHREPLGISFAPALCKQLVGGTVTFDDLESVRPDEYRSLRSLRRLPVESTRMHTPDVLVLQTGGAHGARPGESVYIKGDSMLSGEHQILDMPDLGASEVAVNWEAPLPPPAQLVLRRYRTTEDNVNEILETLSYTVPSRTAHVRDTLEQEREAEPPVSQNRSCQSIQEEEELHVTTDNFEQYLEEVTDKMLRLNFEPHLSELVEGFAKGLGRKEFVSWSPERWPELQRMFRGQPTIDLLAWEQATELEESNDEFVTLVRWWWTVLAEMSREDQFAMLTWSTGWAALPCTGWVGISFVLRNSKQDPSCLPQAHTCNFTVDLPCYTSKEQLETQLKRAVQETGFGFL